MIWYPLGENEDDRAYFDRLNFGKIKLKDAELVKALFLVKDDTTTIVYQKQIAREWDEIEQKLQDDKFWYFLIDNSIVEKSTYPVRIELLLDLYIGNYGKSKREYDTFYKLEEQVHLQDITKVWAEIYSLFLILNEWFEDDTIYHYVGLLNTLKSRKKNYLENFIEVWKNDDSKKSFKNELIREITSLYNERPETLNPLFIADQATILKFQSTIFKNYSSTKFDSLFDDRFSISDIYFNENKPLLQDILLLMNILELKIENKNQEIWKDRFRFDLYKKGKLWSLEHIHSQNDSLNKEEEVIHSIDNLALLTSGDNSSNSDKSFIDKKDNIRYLDMHGSFIPQATKNIFLKYYTLQEIDNESNEWSKIDRKYYYLHLIYLLNEFNDKKYE